MPTPITENETFRVTVAVFEAGVGFCCSTDFSVISLFLSFFNNLAQRGERIKSVLHINRSQIYRFITVQRVVYIVGLIPGNPERIHQQTIPSAFPNVVHNLKNHIIIYAIKILKAGSNALQILCRIISTHRFAIVVTQNKLFFCVILAFFDNHSLSRLFQHDQTGINPRGGWQILIKERPLGQLFHIRAVLV